jgi:ribonuclease VapC
MIVDTSAVVAIFLKESGWEELVRVLGEAPGAGIGTPSLVEAGIVLTSRLGRDARGLLVRFVREFGLVEVPFGESHWLAAVEAYVRYGKGRHPAALNFGDCLTYATARLAHEPLLFVGKDFHKTDIEAALPEGGAS